MADLGDVNFSENSFDFGVYLYAGDVNEYLHLPEEIGRFIAEIDISSDDAPD